MKKYYAVKKGRKKGIYLSWDECKKQVEKFSGAVYKSFSSLEEAKSFIEETLETISTDCLHAYVDGSYNITTKEYGYGCVIIYHNKVVNEYYGKGNNEQLALMRNVSGEILGSLRAMKYAKENNYNEITIYYDYEGIEKWVNGLWKANKEGTIKYQQMVKEYRKNLKINFVKVLAHSGNYYNDRADMLAKKAVGIING